MENGDSMIKLYGDRVGFRKFIEGRNINIVIKGRGFWFRLLFSLSFFE